MAKRNKTKLTQIELVELQTSTGAPAKRRYNRLLRRSKFEGIHWQYP
jgi:hypothetical protein